MSAQTRNHSVCVLGMVRADGPLPDRSGLTVSDESTFEPDEVSALLENRMSGQGHRERLNASLGRTRRYDSAREVQENRHGEERSMYLQEKAVQGSGNYSATTSPISTRRYNTVPPPASLTATPRSLGRTEPYPTGPAARASRAAKIARAPSPRAQGRVRFVGGQRIVNGESASVSASASASASEILHVPSATSATSAHFAQTHTTLPPTRDIIPIKAAPPADAKVHLRPPVPAFEPATRSQVLCETPKPFSEPQEQRHSILERAMAKMRARDAALAKSRILREKASAVEASAIVKPARSLAHDTKALSPPSAAMTFSVVGQTCTLPIRTKVPVAADLQAQLSSPTTILSTSLDSTTPKATLADTASPSATAERALSIVSPAPTMQVLSSPPASHGQLNVFVTNISGQIRTSMRHTLTAAVRATLSLSIDEGTIPPRELVNMAERFARDLEKRAHGLDGVVVAADGLMEESRETES
nr:hypothetical protein CFP56_52513 [Quercus suber]